MPHLSGITIYPVKSLDGVKLLQTAVLPCGALANDRRWRLVDSEGSVMNAKRTARFHAIRADFHGEQVSGSLGGWGCSEGYFVTLSLDPSVDKTRLSSLTSETFQLVPGSRGPCAWLSEALAEDVFLQERVEGGFPDDRDADGPTVISIESLIEVASWFDWDIDECRRRFRMNLEVSAEFTQNSEFNSPMSGQLLEGPFWEDTLASPMHKQLNSTQLETLIDSSIDLPVATPRKFKLGDVDFQAVGVCRRCVVPGRCTQSGQLAPYFRDTFESWRRRRCRPDVDVRNWGNVFRLGINTTVNSAAEARCLDIGVQMTCSG